jgi:hypothetical protein
VLKAACARDEGEVRTFAEKSEYESVETDWGKLVERKDIDAIDIRVPNNLPPSQTLSPPSGQREKGERLIGNATRASGAT